MHRMWSVLTVISVFASLTVAEDCQGMFDWSDEYCCADQALGCYTAPGYLNPMPCCYNDEKDVEYALYTRANKELEDKKRLTRNESLPSEFVPGAKTVFISHGYRSDGHNPGFQSMKDAFLTKEDINVIILDWPSYQANYWRPAAETRTVGKLTALFMEKVATEGQVSYDDIWCLGHSLGSHICGFAGRGIPDGSKIGRITGMDPAGPAFEDDPDVSVGLNSNDAKFVDIIHTDTTGSLTFALGTVRPLGHMDFYVNGRDEQPGCKDKRELEALRRTVSGNKAQRFVDTLISCSHSRVYVYFTETISNGNCFVARSKCTDAEDLPGSCSPCAEGVCAVMGYDSQGSGENGMYLVETSDTAPYCTPAEE